jgi:hypothetical protein
MADSFTQMFTQAAALKSQQMKAQRPRYEALPSFVQNSVYHFTSAPADKDSTFQKFREQGNQDFREGRFE